MNVTVLGATGGLGRNVVDAALARGHEVKALVRELKRAKLPAEVSVVNGDATDLPRVKEACAAEVGAKSESKYASLLACVNG